MYPAIIRPTGILKNLLKNTVVAWKVLRKEKPDLLISSGAAVAVPFFYLAKLIGKEADLCWKFMTGLISRL